MTWSSADNSGDQFEITYRVVDRGNGSRAGLIGSARRQMSRVGTFRAFLKALADEDFLWMQEAGAPGRRILGGARRMTSRLLTAPHLFSVYFAPSSLVRVRTTPGEPLDLPAGSISGGTRTWVSRAAGLWGVRMPALEFEVEFGLLDREAFDSMIPFAVMSKLGARRGSRLSRTQRRGVRPGLDYAVRCAGSTEEWPATLASWYYRDQGPWLEVDGESDESRPAEGASADFDAADASVIHGAVVVVDANSGRALRLASSHAPFKALWPSSLTTGIRTDGASVAPLPTSTLNVEAGVWLGGTRSWYHFLVEGLMGYLQVERQIGTRRPICVQERTPRQILELTERITGSPPIVCRVGERVNFDRLWVAHERSIRTLSDLTEEAGRQLVTIRNLMDSRLPDVTPVAPTRVFFCRGGATLRRLRNQEAIATKLRSVGFIVVDPSMLDLTEQARLFRSAEVIVIESGAAFAGLLLCRSEAKVLEIGPRTSETGFWGAFARALGHSHSGVWGVSQLKVGPISLGSDLGHRIDLDEVMSALSDLKGA